MHYDITLVAIKSSSKLKYLKLEERTLKTAKEVVIYLCHIHCNIINLVLC